MPGALDLPLRFWKRLPLPRALRASLAPAMAALVRWRLRSAPPPRQALEAVEPGPLVLSGFHTEALGLGAAARATRGALEAAGLPVTLHDLSFLRTAPLYAAITLPGAQQGGVWICQCNPPEFERLRLGLDRRDLAGRYRIGVWAWELETLPDLWIKAARSFHEIWAPSRFVADAIRAGIGDGDGPVIHVLPPAVGVAPDRPCDRRPFGIPPDAFVALVMFDMRSTRARKNPDAALDAYCQAFPQPSAAAVLVCKVLARDAAPEAFDALQRRIAGRPDIILITETLTQDAIGDLIACVDIVLSLHRSEGYGLSLAEAMHRGRVVVATAWSGNMDFMDAQSAVLVPHRLISVQDPQKQYPDGARWADPDVAAAARALVDLAASPDRRREIGAAARRRIGDHEAAVAAQIADLAWRDKVIPAQHG